MRDSMLIYRSFYDAIKEIKKENQAEVWSAIFEYSLNFNEIPLKGISKTIFTLIKPQLDANLKRYKSGATPKKLEKRNGSETEANDKRNGSENEANKNKNKNNNLNDNNNHNHNEAENKNKIFGNEILESQEWIETICMQNKITPEEVPKWIDDFNKKLVTELDKKTSKQDYASHFSRWLPSEILKIKNNNGKSNSNSATFAKNR